jgi:hypothetical protein
MAMHDITVTSAAHAAVNDLTAHLARR